MQQQPSSRQHVQQEENNDNSKSSNKAAGADSLLAGTSSAGRLVCTTSHSTTQHHNKQQQQQQRGDAAPVVLGSSHNSSSKQPKPAAGHGLHQGPWQGGAQEKRTAVAGCSPPSRFSLRAAYSGGATSGAGAVVGAAGGVSTTSLPHQKLRQHLQHIAQPQRSAHQQHEPQQQPGYDAHQQLQWHLRHIAQPQYTTQQQQPQPTCDAHQQLRRHLHHIAQPQRIAQQQQAQPTSTTNTPSSPGGSGCRRQPAAAASLPQGHGSPAAARCGGDTAVLNSIGTGGGGGCGGGGGMRVTAHGPAGAAAVPGVSASACNHNNNSSYSGPNSPCNGPRSSNNNSPRSTSSSRPGTAGSQGGGTGASYTAEELLRAAKCQDQINRRGSPPGAGGGGSAHSSCCSTPRKVVDGSRQQQQQRSPRPLSPHHQQQQQRGVDVADQQQQPRQACHLPVPLLRAPTHGLCKQHQEPPLGKAYQQQQQQRWLLSAQQLGGDASSAGSRDSAEQQGAAEGLLPQEASLSHLVESPTGKSGSSGKSILVAAVTAAAAASAAAAAHGGSSGADGRAAGRTAHSRVGASSGGQDGSPKHRVCFTSISGDVGGGLGGRGCEEDGGGSSSSSSSEVQEEAQRAGGYEQQQQEQHQAQGVVDQVQAQELQLQEPQGQQQEHHHMCAQGSRSATQQQHPSQGNDGAGSGDASSKQQQQQQRPQRGQRQVAEPPSRCQPDTGASADISSSDKQHQLLARLCAKHGLPLPQQRRAGHHQAGSSPPQQHGLWGPNKQQQPGRVTQQGGSMVKKREQLLQQLRHSSISRRRQLQPGASAADADSPTPRAAAAQTPAVGLEGPTATGTSERVHSPELEQQLVVFPQQLPSSPAASDLHLVDGLQYVHALLGSIKMPSVSTPTPAAAGTGVGSLYGSSDKHRQQQQQPSAGPPTSEQMFTVPSSQEQEPAAGSGQSLLAARAWLQQQHSVHGGGGACDGGSWQQSGDLQQMCSAALSKLRAAGGVAGCSAGLRDSYEQHGGSSRQHTYIALPLQDALVLLCLLDGNSHAAQQQQRVPHQNHLPQQQLQLQAQHVAHGGCFAGLHAAVLRHLVAPPGDVMHQQAQPGWHTQRQQQQRAGQGLCWGPRQLCMRAVHAVASAQHAWRRDELRPLQQALQQVQQQLWMHQALADAAGGNKPLPGSPTKAAAHIRAGSSSPARQRGSPDRLAATRQQQSSKAASRLSPSRAAARAAAAGSQQQLPCRQPLAATAVAKRLSVAAVLRDGGINFKTTCTGWEGTPVLISLLRDLRNKLLCKLVLHAMRAAVQHAADRNTLLLRQLPVCLPPLQLSAAFGAWRAWAADRGGVRGVRQDVRHKLRLQRAAVVLRAWRGAAQERAWLRARQVALQQRRQRLTLLAAFKAWRCACADQQLDGAQHALAVLWHARITSAQVLLAWLRAVRQAALLAAVTWADTDDTGCDDPTSADSSSSPSRRQSSETRQTAAQSSCSQDLSASLELQRPWRARVLAAVEATRLHCRETYEAATTARAGMRAQMPPLLASAQLLLQSWKEQRQLRVAQQQEEQQELRRLGLLAGDTDDDDAALAGREKGQQRREGDRRLRAEWSAMLLTDDSSSYVLPDMPGFQHNNTNNHHRSHRRSSSSDGDDNNEDATGVSVTQERPQGLSIAGGIARHSAPGALVPPPPAAHDVWCAGGVAVGEVAAACTGQEPAAASGAPCAVQSAQSQPWQQDMQSPGHHLLLQQQPQDQHSSHHSCAHPTSSNHAASAAPGVQQLMLQPGDHLRQHGQQGCYGNSNAAHSHAAAAVTVASAASGVGAGGQQAQGGLTAASPGVVSWHDATGAAAAVATSATATPVSGEGAAAVSIPTAASAAASGPHCMQDSCSGGGVAGATAVTGSPLHRCVMASQTQAPDSGTMAVGSSNNPMLLAGAATAQHGQFADSNAAAGGGVLVGLAAVDGGGGSGGADVRVDAASSSGGDSSRGHSQGGGLSSESTVDDQHRHMQQLRHMQRTVAAAAQDEGEGAVQQQRALEAVAAAGGGAGVGGGVAEAAPYEAAHTSGYDEAVTSRPQSRAEHQPSPAAGGGGTAAATAALAPTCCSSQQLLHESLHHWQRLVRGKALLVRVFGAAEQAWEERERQESAVTAAGMVVTGPHAHDFRLMRRAFDSWSRYAEAQLQEVSALAAVEAATSYYSSRLTVKAWRAWRVYLSQVPAVQQRYSSALVSVCLLGWHQHTLQQRQDPHSRASVRLLLRTRTGGWCGSEQQWRRAVVVSKAFGGWRQLVIRGALHYRLRLLASALTSWQLATEDTQQLVASFQQHWQRPRLLQHCMLLWRSLVLLLKQQRQEAAHAEAWHAARLKHSVLMAWADVTGAQAERRAALAVVASGYERRLLRRKLLQWSLVACASTAARCYYQQGLLNRCVAAWRRLIAESAAGALQAELMLPPPPPPQQQLQQQQTAGVVLCEPADHHNGQQLWQQEQLQWQQAHSVQQQQAVWGEASLAAEVLTRLREEQQQPSPNLHLLQPLPLPPAAAGAVAFQARAAGGRVANKSSAPPAAGNTAGSRSSGQRQQRVFGANPGCSARSPTRGGRLNSSSSRVGSGEQQRHRQNTVAAALATRSPRSPAAPTESKGVAAPAGSPARIAAVVRHTRLAS